MEFCAFESFEFVTILIGEQSTEKWNKHLAENIGKIVGKSLNIRKINSFHFILSLGKSSNEYKLVYLAISQTIWAS